MKKLILISIFFSFNIMGAYQVKLSDLQANILDCNQPLTIYKSCIGECVDIDKSFNCEYSEIDDEMIDNPSSPILIDGEVVGYNQMASGRKIIVSNQAKKDAYEATKASKKASEDAIVMAQKAMACGNRVMALLSVRNASKGLTGAQVKQIVNTYSEIKALLETGSLETAKTEMLAVVADGVLVTENDKTALVSELDSCKN